MPRVRQQISVVLIEAELQESANPMGDNLWVMDLFYNHESFLYLSRIQSALRAITLEEKTRKKRSSGR
jgi:hypothetical protein